MAERNGSGGDGDGHGPVESGQQDDRSRVEAERDVLAGDTPSDEDELNDNDDVGERAERESATGLGRQEATPENDETDEERPAGTAGQAGDAVQDGQDDPFGEDTAEVIDFRGRENGAGGTDVAADPEDPEDRETSEDDEDLVSLSALQADDELLDALGGTDPDIAPNTGDNEPDLESLLMAWRRDVDAAPIGDLVDTDAAVAAVNEGRARPRRRKLRHLVPVATAAAVLMITFTGVGLAARDALPGDALWGVAQVLYTDHARSAQAASRAEKQLDKASTAWEQGQREQAQEALQRARKQMQTVDAEEGLSDLQAAHASLSAKFERRQEEPTSSSSEPTSSSKEPVPSSSSGLPSPSSGLLPPPPPPDPTSTEPSAPSTSSEESSNPTSTPSSPSSGSSGRSPSSGSSMRSTENSGLLPP